MKSRDDKLALIFMRERAGLSRYLSARAGSSEDGEDLAQEAWIRFSRNGAQALKAPVPYLRRIVRNLAIDQGRASSRRRLTPLEIEDLLALPDDSPSPEETLNAKSELLRLIDIMAEMPERRRAILVAARLDEKPHREIAEAHGVSTRTVELEIRAAIEYCSRRLSENGPATDKIKR
ncbi:RNA polymerase sigma factor [Ensifer sp.]|jgi:RNA polymerase sigma-70 factor (ECF subfamily)|uniref:RNA polymerase sigma factor n=1 Tax=Ensifer sp. TaxID=1872086 RepID=UPI002E135B88|nr:RNA polymerase sigma factor [Ensifer sp.]